MALAPLFLSAVMAASTGASLTVDVRDASTMRSVPPGALRVVMLSMTLTASCENDVSVRGITLRHRGLGSSSDIESVYLLSDGRRITDGRSIASRDGRVHLSIRDVVIPACKSQKFDVAADYSPQAAVAGEHRFVLASAADVDAPGTAVMLTKTVIPTTIIPSGVTAGRVSVEYLSLHRNPLYGNNRTLARLRLSADGRDDQYITSVTLTNDGSARDSDLQHLSLESSGGRTLTNTVPSLDGDRLALTFSPPLLLGKNSEKLLELHGDVRASRTRTIRFVVKEPSDLRSSTRRPRS